MRPMAGGGGEASREKPELLELGACRMRMRMRGCYGRGGCAAAMGEAGPVRAAHIRSGPEPQFIHFSGKFIVFFFFFLHYNLALLIVCPMDAPINN